MPMKPVTPPDNTFMIVNIDEDGAVITVTDWKGDPADPIDPFPGGKKPVPVGAKKVYPHSVFTYQKNPNCVTYYFPGGVRTV